jgi:hypothetical protein
MLGARTRSGRARRGASLAVLALLGPFEPQGERGRYVVSWREDPPRLRVEADLPIEGRELAMDATRPGRRQSSTRAAGRPWSRT